MRSQLTAEEIESTAIDSPVADIARQAKDYLASDGEHVDHPVADRLILLYVTGRKTGAIRRVPLVTVEHDGALIIVASKGGAPTHPTWYRNLEANPTVWVRNKADFYEARAEILDGEQRDAAFGAIADVMPFFRRYAERTDRSLPVIRLVRI